jgi:glycosyltransferase involved in cell wall biosynthesis
MGKAARAAGVDLVHVPYFAAPLRQHVPHVVTVHDVIPLLFPVYAGGRAMRAYLRLVSAGARRAAQVIADSECSRRDAIRVLGLDTARVTAIPLAVGPEFQPTADHADMDGVRARLGLDGKRIVFNVAGLDVRKNVATLLRAFARVAGRTGSEVVMVIGGKAHGNPGLYPDLAPLARSLGIADRVRFPGFLTAREKIALYHAAVCYAAPSRYEGFGLTPLEAMACGTPVIAADASCTREVVGDAALLLGPDDVDGFAEALLRVLTDGAEAERMRAAGLRRAAGFSWQRTAAATLAVYQRAGRAAAGEPQPRRDRQVEVTQ